MVLDALAEHARAERPHECCGLLIGRGDRILESIPTRNAAPDSTRRYEIAPSDYVAQIKLCRLRNDGAEVIGCYHSHPHSDPAPSETDLAAAFGDFLFVILGPVDDSAPLDVRAYRLADQAFHPVALLTS